MCHDSVYISSEFWTTIGLTGLLWGDVGTSATVRRGQERERERKMENERVSLIQHQ